MGRKTPPKWTEAELAARVANLEKQEEARPRPVVTVKLTHFSSTLEIHEGYVEDCPECEEEDS